MVDSRIPDPEEVDQLLLNAQLRDDLEPYVDESLSRIDFRNVPTQVENEYLASMLAWEEAPVLPIYKWFTPELIAPRPESLGNEELAEILWDVIDKLFKKRILLDFTDHLSDRELYSIIYRDILPSREKKLTSTNHFLHWDCANISDDPDAWLRYYASEAERQDWAVTTRRPLPPASQPPHSRRMPRRPL
ncbi:MAG: hypothetical protein HQ581_10900 [Planctomycetes bacterium]|nr:hypothetical protein [Planctomycetota bacterium]